jgi:hypothetical protein
MEAIDINKYRSLVHNTIHLLEFVGLITIIKKDYWINLIQGDDEDFGKAMLEINQCISGSNLTVGPNYPFIRLCIGDTESDSPYDTCDSSDDEDVPDLI